MGEKKEHEQLDLATKYIRQSEMFPCPSLQEWWINFQAPMMLDFPDVWVQTLTSQTHMSHYHTSLMQNKLTESHETPSLSLSSPPTDLV